MILTKLNNILFKIQTWFAVACLTVFFCGVAFQVFSRILGIPANFTEEVSNYAFIWVTFMGTALMLRENRHFRFTSLSSVSLGWAWLCLPLCGFTSTMYCIEAIYKFIRDPSSREIVDEATAAIREAELAEQQAGQTQNQGRQNGAEDQAVDVFHEFLLGRRTAEGERLGTAVRVDSEPWCWRRVNGGRQP